MLELKACGEYQLEEELSSIDLHKVLAVYNFSFWYDGRSSWIILDLRDPTVALVSTDGYVRLYGVTCSEDFVGELEHVLGISEDLSGFFKLGAGDPLLGEFLREFKGWRLRLSPLWWSLVIGVCQQNASFRQGWRMLQNIVKLLGKAARAGDREVLLPPGPEEVLASASKLREAGVGYRAGTIVNIAKAFSQGELSEELLKGLNSREAEENLVSIRGVGKYTARLALALTYRKYDLPPVDRWLGAIIAEVYGVEEKKAEGFWSMRWGEWAGLAAIAVTVALDAVPLRKALDRVRRGILKPVLEDIPTPYSMWRFARL